ncbi:MAG: hypothetical protein L0154_23835 [Chloroflexi bacterium]|nr:hypothetical protein [Chloroflexota bacterium]
MAERAVTLTIPDHIYEQAQKLAETSGKPIEMILLHELENAFLPPLPEAEEAELDALQHLSDEALWTIAREKMPRSQQDRMQHLMDKNNLSELSGAEQAELESLVEQGQRLMLRKGKAAALLTERGHIITTRAISD